jgi:hypothetical protein
MALTIMLTVNGQKAKIHSGPSVSFDGNDADYWYLWSTMIKEIENKTGELIDLYDDAEFSGENLHELEAIVAKHVANLKNKKETEWDVHTGTALLPVKKEIYKTLSKKDLEAKLKAFLAIVRQAIAKNEKVICIGD